MAEFSLTEVLGACFVMQHTQLCLLLHKLVVSLAHAWVYIIKYKLVVLGQICWASIREAKRLSDLICGGLLVARDVKALGLCGTK